MASKNSPSARTPIPHQLFESQAWSQLKRRLSFLVEHHGVGLLTGEVGAGQSTAVRQLASCFNSSFYRLLYLHWTSGSALDDHCASL